MAQISVNVPDPQLETVARAFGWTEESEETNHRAFITDVVRRFLRDHTAGTEGSKAAQSAAQARRQEINEGWE